MDLSVIIVNFNTRNFLKNCLKSVLKEKDLSLEVIVIDNASSDDSGEMVKKEFPQVKLIENKRNLGFARANNQGIKLAQGEYILLLNSDTEVMVGALKKLVEFAQSHSEAGVVGARLLNPDGSIQPSVYHFPKIWRAIAEYWFGQKEAYEKYALTGTDPVKVEAVTGAAMLIPRTTIEKVGLLDERYFFYFEDLDYCRKVKKAGLKVYYYPAAEIIHYHGKSAVKVSSQAHQWLCQSSKIYNGILKYWLLTVIIWLGQKWQKLKKKSQTEREIY